MEHQPSTLSNQPRPSKRFVIVSWALVAAWAFLIFFMSSNTGTGLNTGLGIFSSIYRAMQAVHEHSPLNDDEPDQSRFSPVLGENVRRMRSYSNITKTRLALMVSIGRPLLNRIEDGTADVRLSVVTKLADSLATTPSFLLAKHSDEDIRHEIAHRKASSPVAAVLRKRDARS